MHVDAAAVAIHAAAVAEHVRATTTSCRQPLRTGGVCCGGEAHILLAPASPAELIAGAGGGGAGTHKQQLCPDSGVVIGGRVVARAIPVVASGWISVTVTTDLLALSAAGSL